MIEMFYLERLHELKLYDSKFSRSDVKVVIENLISSLYKKDNDYPSDCHGYFVDHFIDAQNRLWLMFDRNNNRLTVNHRLEKLYKNYTFTDRAIERDVKRLFNKHFQISIIKYVDWFDDGDYFAEEHLKYRFNTIQKST